MVKRADERGVALIFVLWLLVLLGAIIADVASRARSEAAILSTLRSRTVARNAAESGVLAATVGIEALLDSAQGATERIAAFRGLEERLAALREVDLGRARFGIAVVDLNSRIDLNRADEAALRGLFGQFTSESRAGAIAAALKRVPPVERLGELLQIPGVDDSLALAVAPYVTVWGDGVVNVNSAPEPVLAALPGIGSAAARSVVRRRAGGEVFTSLDAARPPRAAGVAMVQPGPPLSAVPTRLMVISRGWQDGQPLTHEIQAVFAIVGQRLVLQASWERDL